MNDDRGGNEVMFDGLSVSAKVDFGRQVARMLDTAAIPHKTVSRSAITAALDKAYMAREKAK